MTIVGAFSAGGERMDEWLPEFVGDYGRERQPILSGFADRLGRLTSDISGGERECRTVIHIAGYVIQSPSTRRRGAVPGRFPGCLDGA